jgi:phytoene dehydrogenase-like protein
MVGSDALPARYLDGLRRFRYGTGVFKVDVALDGPAPWSAPELAHAGVVHLTGDLDDMATAAHQARRGIVPSKPMLIVGQQTVADPSRAPAGGHTLWVETHVPPVPRDTGSWASSRDSFFDVVMGRLEDHAPGLGARVRGTAVRTPQDLEAENPNLVGGDLGAGSTALDQQLVFRPVPGWFRYATPVKGLYLCSASTHPGGGVHGMAGHNCARRVLADRRRRRI